MTEVDAGMAERAEAREEAREQKGQDRYRLAIDALLCDGVFCEEDAKVLDGFRDHIGLSAESAAAVFHEQAQAYIRHRILQFLEDGSISPGEDTVLDDLVASIGLGPMWSLETEQALVSARHTWALASGPLPVVETDLGLVGREVAHVTVNAEAYEERTRSVGMTYGGLSFSIPIFKGLRYRAGQYGVSRQTVNYQHRLGSGDLTVTDRRLIFRSPERALTSRLTSIIDITNYSDGVTIQRTVGKPITYVMTEPDEDFTLILWRAWQEARGVSDAA